MNDLFIYFFFTSSFLSSCVCVSVCGWPKMNCIFLFDCHICMMILFIDVIIISFYGTIHKLWVCVCVPLSTNDFSIFHVNECISWHRAISTFRIVFMWNSRCLYTAATLLIVYINCDSTYFLYLRTLWNFVNKPDSGGGDDWQ